MVSFVGTWSKMSQDNVLSCFNVQINLEQKSGKYSDMNWVQLASSTRIEKEKHA